MDLADFALRYCRLVDGSQGYRDQLTCCVSRLDQFAGRRISTAELSEQLLNDWLESMRDRVSPTTRRQRRNMILRLWRDAVRHGDAARKPDLDDVARVKASQRLPQAWSVDQVRHLLHVASGLAGAYDGQWPKSLFWRSWILTDWDTGWRASDLRLLEIGQVRDRMAHIQRKTGRPVWSRLRPPALAAIAAWLDATGRDRRLVWPQWYCRSTWVRICKRLVRRAGLPGSIGWLRASAGTACELEHPQRGYLFLGNTPAVFYGHYFDRRLSDDFPQPPQL